MRGHGYATEIAQAGVEGRPDADPDVPVIAWIMPHNVASLRVVRTSGIRRLRRLGQLHPAAVSTACTQTVRCADFLAVSM